MDDEAFDIWKKKIGLDEKRIKRLGERSQEITQVVGLINSIAERTGILALNASMQATAAGEAGADGVAGGGLGGEGVSAGDEVGAWRTTAAISRRFLYATSIIATPTVTTSGRHDG